jgi:hypothetical protein
MPGLRKPGAPPPKPGNPGSGLPNTPGVPIPGAVPPMGGLTFGDQIGGNPGGTGSATGDPGLAAIWAMLKKAGFVPPTVVPVKIGR